MTRVLAVARGETLATELAGGTRVGRSAGRLVATTRGRGPEGPVRMGSVTSPPGKVAPVTTEETVPSAAWASPAVGPVLVTADALAQRVA